MKIIKNNYQYIIYSLLSIISVYNYILSFFNSYYLSYFIIVLLFILFFLFYKYLNNCSILEKKYKIFIIIMSFMFVLGYSYNLTSSSNLLFGNIRLFILSILKISGFYFFFKTLIIYYLKFMSHKINIHFKLLEIFKNHPFFCSFIFLSICYSVFLILYYPGIINYDNANQIKEMMGIHTRYLDAINYIEGSTLTNFNPIVHTFLLGGCFKIGYLLNNVNLGIFFFTILQLLIVISTYSYTIYYCLKNNCNEFITFIILLILGFVPLFGYYSITLVKDTLYTCFLLLFSIKIYELMKNNKINYITIFLISILVCLFRNNGIFIVLVTLLFILNRNKKLIIVLLCILLFYVSFNNILLPKLKVSSTSIREVLSIPFQQTARVVKIYGDKIPLDDKLVIDKILDYDNLAIDYKEYLADPVKNKYNKDATTNDLKNYLIIWIKYLFKYPVVYLDAFINNISGYFYPFQDSWKVYHKLNPKLKEAGFDYHYNNLKLEREYMHNYEVFIEKTPIGLFLNIALLVWFSILVFIMLHKNNLFLIPNIISIIFCFLSPANTYFRYIYPTLILMVCLFPLIKSNMELKK